MTTQDVHDRIARIVLVKHDFEAAHAMEDELMADVLKAIANGAENPVDLAIVALQVKEIDFPRVCA